MLFIVFKNIILSLIDEDQYELKREKLAITEMGGKNAIIVTNNCELDETVSGVIYTAFAHAGQKCSAASRIIIHKEVKESFIERFKEAVKDVQSDVKKGNTKGLMSKPKTQGEN